MKQEEIYALRVKHGLLLVPKREKRQRVLAAMVTMFKEGLSEAEVRQVVSGSKTAWRRMTWWYREYMSIPPGEPLTAPARLQGWSWDLPYEDRVAVAMREAIDAPTRGELRDLALLEGAGCWSWLVQSARKHVRAELAGVVSLDGRHVGDDWTQDWHYSRARRRRQAEAVANGTAKIETHIGFQL